MIRATQMHEEQSLARPQISEARRW